MKQPRIDISVVGLESGHRGSVDWPAGWPIPDRDDTISWGGMYLRVRSVTWYPEGDNTTREPFVYVVVGP